MKRLKNKVIKLMQVMDEIKSSQGTNLFFSALSEDSKRDYYNIQRAIKIFYDNL